MDSGRYRASQSGGMVNRSEQPQAAAHRAAPQAQPQPRQVEEDPQPRSSHHRAPAPQAERPARFERRRPRLPLLIIVGVLVLALLAWGAYSFTRNANTGIDGGRYQAVFLSNGQTYFGKLSVQNDDYMRLTDIYYLQTQAGEESADPQATTDQSNVQLIKLGDEVHGPEDEMIISKDQILFYENLKTDGSVANSIQQFQQSN